MESDTHQTKKFKSSYGWLHRIIAISFIFLIIFGNIWMARYILGADPQPWVRNGFMICVAASFVFGMALAVKLTLQYFGIIAIESIQHMDDEVDSENDKR